MSPKLWGFVWNTRTHNPCDIAFWYWLRVLCWSQSIAVIFNLRHNSVSDSKLNIIQLLKIINLALLSISVTSRVALAFSQMFDCSCLHYRISPDNLSKIRFRVNRAGSFQDTLDMFRTQTNDYNPELAAAETQQCAVTTHTKGRWHVTSAWCWVTHDDITSDNTFGMTATMVPGVWPDFPNCLLLW